MDSLNIDIQENTLYCFMAYQGHLQQQHKSILLQGFDLSCDPCGLADWGPFWGGPAAPNGVPAPCTGALELGDVAKVDSELPSTPIRPLHRDCCALVVDVPTTPIEAGPIVTPPVLDALWTIAGVELTRSVTLQDIWNEFYWLVKWFKTLQKANFLLIALNTDH